MKKLLFAFLIFPALLFGQFSDDFSDGDFTTNPSWQGDTEKFMINENHELQLADNQESTAFLSVNQQRIDSTEWLFDAALHFSPSGNNNARIYLAANSANPDLITESVFLQLGESGSEDALTLYHQNADVETMICKGSNGLISTAFSLPVKITYREPGVWRIFIDPLNNGSYVSEAEGSYPVSFSSSGFIVFCKYTISNSEDFVFDNFVVRPFQVDVTAPEVVSFEVISQYTLEIGFSEPVVESGAINTLNYLLNGSIHPEEVIFDEVLKDKVNLIFAEPFSNNTEYQLLISGVEDGQGNLMNPHEETFSYIQPYEPQTHEIVINELMVDVNPEPNGLPAYDYLELYNTTQRLMDLSGCVVQWSSHQREIPDGITLKPGHFLVLTDDDADFEEGIPVINFSSLPLNTEAEIIIRNTDLQIIHALNYKKEWYHDEEKEEGGWSLEMIDPDNPCGAITNFSASVDQDGGTPGMINSVFDENPDVENPLLSHAKFVSDSILSLRFSESMDSAALKKPQNYLLSPPGISP
ncbi:MAG TPA: lamin tail domain-containing protein, partial [Bacteroidales bacterium]|nr:lamin tail domain-containing protein [Bacteroidales bacterium]